MGTQFFWFFDIAVVILFVAFIFKGVKKGFVAEIAGLVSLAIAFVLALSLSETVSNAIYENIIKDVVTEEINNQISSAIENSLVSQINSIDMSKAKVNSRELSEISSQPDSAGKVSIDLSHLDLSETGISDIDLSAFGITNDTFDYSSVNLGTVVMNADEVKEHGVDKIIVASLLTDNLIHGTAFGSICGAVEDMAETIPSLMSGISESVESGDKSVIKNIVLSILDAPTDDFARSITDNMIKPVLLVPIRALIFTVLFIVITIILNLIVKVLKGVNKIPLIGGINKILGAVSGAAEGIIIIFVICIFIQVIISLSDNSLIFLNTMTIDETYIFHKIYYFEFLNFLA